MGKPRHPALGKVGQLEVEKVPALHQLRDAGCEILLECCCVRYVHDDYLLHYLRMTLGNPVNPRYAFSAQPSLI